MKLKKYQQESLDTLSNFLQDSKVCGVEKAYEKYAIDNPFNQHATKYKPITGLESVPYVCVRIPTGGGKTILASHSIEVAKNYMHKDFPFVLWLVPSTTILNQTVDALKIDNHPYREAINKTFGRNVSVFNIDEYKTINKNTVDNNVCIIVSTIQKLKVENTDGRKVYADYEDYQEFFTTGNIPTELERDDEKNRPKYSFANICYMQRPLVIVDEAHNAIKPLSEELHRRLNPSMILEFTATPKQRNNVLVSVSAQALKEEDMIKMPVELYEYPEASWDRAVSGATTHRKALEEVCKKENENIRPIVLYQAKDKNSDITPAMLKQHLIDNENIPAEKIAIATGERRELDNIDIFSPTCPIEHIITVQALKEGWDCSFAYIFCSVANIKSETDVEQLLGRVLRQPNAKRRENDVLNRAYAHLPSGSFAETAKLLKDKLIDMGFDEEEAEQAVQTPTQQVLADLPLLDNKEVIPVNEGFDMNKLKSETIPVSIKVDDDGNKSLVFDKAGDLSDEDTQYIKKNLRENLSEIQERFIHRTVDDLAEKQRLMTSPCAMGKTFAPIPQLEFDYGDGLMEITEETLLFAINWNPLNDPDCIGKLEIIEEGKKFILDIKGGKLEYEFESAHQQELNLNESNWTKEALIGWLDKNIVLKPITMLTTGVRRDFVENNIDFNVENGMELQEIANNKYIFKTLLLAILEKSKEKYISEAYQQFLFEPDAKLHTNQESLFVSHKYEVSPTTRYRGAFKFKKHFFGSDKIDDLKSDGEEFDCACELDSLIDVEFWVRNTVRKKHSFRLPLPNGQNYYPDFVAQLNNGKLLVVEYKGEPYVTNDDSKEKDRVGNLWASVTNNIHVMVSKEKGDITEQLIDAINREK